MEVNLLKSFVAVAETRSISRAAAVLNLTQSALSRQIARLETDLGTRLFERYGRHVECTADGQFLLPLAQVIIARTDETIALMRERAGTQAANSVRLGASGMVFAHYLTPILAGFVTANPTLKLDLIEGNDVELEEAVIAGKLDCAVYTPWKAGRAVGRLLTTEEIFLVVPRDHPLAAVPAVTPPLLANERLLLPPPFFNTSSVVLDVLRLAGVKPKTSYRALYPELLKNLVREGLGLTLMPKMLTSPDTLEGLVAVPFEERVERKIVLIYAFDRPLPAAARALIAHIQKQAADLSPGTTRRRAVSDRSRRSRHAVEDS
jgi:LysR family transcriptional regulator, transcription activator of glutamate synthase operon